MDLIYSMCFGLFKDSGCDFKRSELLYSFIQKLAGVIKLALSSVRFTASDALSSKGQRYM